MILAIMGRTASGKNAIGNALKELYGYEEMVSYTTRPIREGETDGIDYHFLTMEECQKKLDAGEFLELVQYGGNYYGTGKKEIEEMCDPSKKCIFVCTPDGAEQIKKFAGEENVKCVYVSASQEERMKRYMNREGKGGWSNENVITFRNRTRDEDETFKSATDIADVILVNESDTFVLYSKDDGLGLQKKISETFLDQSFSERMEEIVRRLEETISPKMNVLVNEHENNYEEGERA